jgi:hypothetical protein
MNYDEEEFLDLAHQDLIHIHKKNTRGRKCQTIVVGIPECFDFKKMLKFWKNVLMTSNLELPNQRSYLQRGKGNQRARKEAGGVRRR